MNNLQLEIVSPSGRVFQGDVTGVQAPGVEGSFEVLFNHAPMISAFEVGSIRVSVPGGEPIVFATSGGFLEVLANHVSVLAESAELGSEIDIERAQKAEERALKRLEESGGDADRVRASAALERARNRTRVAMATVGQSRKF
jgi:F-type H+-transporting ATPase subunit epsilon